jgi:signal peptidase I
LSSYIREFRAYLRKNDLAKGLFLVGIVLLGAVAVWGGIRLALNTEYPILVVSSPSMCPPTNCVLPVGALIVIKGDNPNTVQVGQIIVFRPYDTLPNYLVVHRVHAILPSDSNSACAGQVEFQTQGDANPGPDSWPDCPNGGVTGSRLVGVYQGTIPIPFLGSAILAIRSFMYNDTTGQPNPQGIIVIVALIAALFAFEVLEPTKKEDNVKKSTATTETTSSSTHPAT